MSLTIECQGILEIGEVWVDLRQQNPTEHQVESGSSFFPRLSCLCSRAIYNDIQFKTCLKKSRLKGLGSRFVWASQDCLKDVMYKNVTCSKIGVGNSAIF